MAFDKAVDEFDESTTALHETLKEEVDTESERLGVLFSQLTDLEEKRTKWWERYDALIEEHGTQHPFPRCALALLVLFEQRSNPKLCTRKLKRT